MSSSAEVNFPASEENPSSCKWRFTWEAQSHTSNLRLILFNSSFKPYQSTNFTVNLSIPQSLLTVTFSEPGTTLRVPIPRVLIDPEASVHSRTFDDHIEVKLSLLLPVDHPLVSELDLSDPDDEKPAQDTLFPLSVNYEIKKLSAIEEVYFYCRSCSNKLTKGIRLFNEMPSVDWQDVADNWFGTCCCSFGGISEKLVKEFAKSYSCTTGACLITGAAVNIYKEDLIGCEFPKPKADQTCNTFKLKDEEKLKSMVGMSSETNRQIRNHSNNGCCSSNNVCERFSKENEDEMTIELLDTQKIFLKGCLGDAFMVRPSNLSKDVKWIEYFCPKCSSLIGSYPCSGDSTPLDDGVRLYKYNVSTCLPVLGSNDLFRNYTLERMFSRRLLEAAQDELSFRTVVRDIHSKTPLSQIVLLNPNTWCFSGCCIHDMEPVPKINMYPAVKLLFSANIGDMELEPRKVEEWVNKNQSDEVYMLPSQVTELITNLEMANKMWPPSHMLLQGFYMASLKR